MQYTPNYNLRLPDEDDVLDVVDLNDNMRALDTAVTKKTESEVFDITVPTAAWSSDVLTIEHEAIPPAGSGDVCIGIADDATAAQVAAARSAAPFVGVLGSQVSGSVQYKAEGTTLPTIDLRLRLTIMKF
jgi:hypothetical protein